MAESHASVGRKVFKGRDYTPSISMVEVSAGSSFTARVHALALFAVLGFALLLRLIALRGAGHPPLMGDEVYYVSHGNALARGEGYGDSFRPPLWPSLIAIGLRTVGDLDALRF